MDPISTVQNSIFWYNNGTYLILLHLFMKSLWDLGCDEETQRHYHNIFFYSPLPPFYYSIWSHRHQGKAELWFWAVQRFWTPQGWSSLATLWALNVLCSDFSCKGSALESSESLSFCCVTPCQHFAESRRLCSDSLGQRLIVVISTKAHCQLLYSLKQKTFYDSIKRFYFPKGGNPKCFHVSNHSCWKTIINGIQSDTE